MIVSITRHTDHWHIIVAVGPRRMELWTMGSRRDAMQSALEAINRLKGE